MERIDFVLPWVDESDKVWLEQKNKYLKNETDVSSSDPEAKDDCRYRDYGLLKYWFRSVEHFAPWVNRVYFVTCGQKPDWLDESNPKLRLINHADYIPADYLPTFQSNTIELNLHRIEDLSERFVLFNDDTFLLRPVQPEFFFKKGLPVIPCELATPCWLGYNNISRVVINNYGILKQYRDIDKLIWKNIWRFIDVRSLGFSRAAKNFFSYLINRTYIPGSFGHLPQSHLKSTIDTIWCKVPHVFDMTSRSRFRRDDCVNHWLACSWNMVSGLFYPAHERKRGVFFIINKGNLASICDTIERQSAPLFCVSDKGSVAEMDHCFQKVSEAFGRLLPEKSSFEK